MMGTMDVMPLSTSEVEVMAKGTARRKELTAKSTQQTVITGFEQKKPKNRSRVKS